MNRALCTVLAAFLSTLFNSASVQAASNTLTIIAVGYDSSQGVEWIQIKNISVGMINLGDYAIGDEESVNEGEAMHMLPDVDLASGEILTMRIRADGTWLYSNQPNPTYCWDCNSGGYTDLAEYGAWDAGTPNLADNDHVILVKTNGGAGDADGTSDDEVIDAVCWGSGIKDYIDFDNDNTQDPGDPDIFLESGCLSASLATNGSLRRSNTGQDTDSKSDWANNPTQIKLESFSAQESQPRDWPLFVRIGTLLGILAAIGAVYLHYTNANFS
jgi:hypothetical protein